MGVLQNSINQVISTLGIVGRFGPGYEKKQELYNISKEEGRLRSGVETLETQETEDYWDMRRDVIKEYRKKRKEALENVTEEMREEGANYPSLPEEMPEEEKEKIWEGHEKYVEEKEKKWKASELERLKRGEKSVTGKREKEIERLYAGPINDYRGRQAELAKKKFELDPSLDNLRQLQFSEMDWKKSMERVNKLYKGKQKSHDAMKAYSNFITGGNKDGE